MGFSKLYVSLKLFAELYVSSSIEVDSTKALGEVGAAIAAQQQMQ